MAPLWSVLAKELREVMRDRRSALSGLFYGVWGPLVMGLALTATARDRDVNDALVVPVDRAAAAPTLMAYLRDRRVRIVEPSSGLEDAIRRRDVPVALAIGNEYERDFTTSRPAEVVLLYDGSWTPSRRRADRLRSLLADYARQAADTRLIMRGVSPRAITPLDVAERDFSTPASRAAGAMATLPMFVLLAAFVGGMSVAADVTSGERERATLESLLLSPAPPAALVCGKWVATALTALATVTVTLVVSQLVLAHPRIAAIDLPVGLSPREASGMWAVLAPLAFAAAAVQLAIGFVARTYKEAQTHLSLLMFVPMVPGFLLAFDAVPHAPWMSWVPLLGQHLAITDIVGGHPLEAASLIGLQVFTVATTVAALAAACAVISRESVLQRVGG